MQGEGGAGSWEKEREGLEAAQIEEVLEIPQVITNLLCLLAK